MKYLLKRFDSKLQGEVYLTSSKSESNRALLINALSGNQLQLHNLSAARDTQTMHKLLQQSSHSLSNREWDVLDAGTTMRFCTAFLAIHGNGDIITGTARMCERPIGLLVDALKKLGAKIEYMGKNGFPPLKIYGINEQLTDTIEIPGNVSSQFISALLMIGPCLPRGLKLRLTTEIFSRPYIEMTLKLMEKFGVSHDWHGDTISLLPQKYHSGVYTIESDWSGASYWYSMAALGKESTIKLHGLKKDSLQGDQEIARIMSYMGIETTYDESGALLKRTQNVKKELKLDFKTCPDLGQTVMVAAAALGIRLEMTGLESLRIKETDRIAALQNELDKIGAELREETRESWTLIPGHFKSPGAAIATYDDHRMAMAFAPLCQLTDLIIEDPHVVQKSYPDFWKDLQSIGVSLTEK